MVKETFYDKLVGSYVRILRKSGPSVGKLIAIDFAKAILNPYVNIYNTDMRSDIRIENSEWMIPYDNIESIQGLSDGECYMQRIVDDSNIANEFSVRMKIGELKAKGIQDTDLEKRILGLTSTK